MKSVISFFSFLILSLVIYLHYSERFAYFNGLIYHKFGFDLQAAEMFDKACCDKNFQACVDLGMMYEEGHGVDQNHTRALELYQSAHNHGFIPAQHHLERMNHLISSQTTGIKD